MNNSLSIEQYFTFNNEIMHLNRLEILKKKTGIQSTQEKYLKYPQIIIKIFLSLPVFFLFRMFLFSRECNGANKKKLQSICSIWSVIIFVVYFLMFLTNHTHFSLLSIAFLNTKFVLNNRKKKKIGIKYKYLFFIT